MADYTHFETLDGMAFRDSDGITYQDSTGFKTFKTLNGFNRFIKRKADMHGATVDPVPDISIIGGTRTWPPACTDFISRADWVH